MCISIIFVFSLQERHTNSLSEFLFWFFLIGRLLSICWEKKNKTNKKNNRTQTHGRRMCFSCIQVDNFRHVCHRGSIFFFFCTKMSKTRATLKFLAVFLKGVKCRGYINAKIQITLDTNSSWAICYLCIPRWTAKQNKTKQSQKWPEISSVQMCEKNIEIPPPSSPPFWLTLNSQRILRILIFEKKKFHLFPFITQKISPIREL